MTPNEQADRDVHTEHCCIIHGCKYGNDDICTVATKKAKQSTPCEQCYQTHLKFDDLLKRDEWLNRPADDAGDATMEDLERWLRAALSE